MAPKFLTFEELVKDHERLCAEVEELKRAFRIHTHRLRGNGEVMPKSPYEVTLKPAK